MQAGFARRAITPPIGCVMEGFNLEEPAAAVHDDLFIRAVWLQEQARAVLIVAADLLFMERTEMAVIKRRLRETVGLGEADVLFNFSHTHSGPRVTRWHYSGEPDPDYIDHVANAARGAAEEARSRLREVTIEAGVGRSELPVSRRRPNAKGEVEWGPCASEPVWRALPVCLLRDADGGVLAALFSVACHPSINRKNEVTADFAGSAVAELNARYNTDGFVFLQGGGGDAKPRTVAVGNEYFRDGSWQDVREAGEQVADEVTGAINAGLQPVTPGLATAQMEMRLDLQGPLGRDALTALAGNEAENSGRRAWARDMLARLVRGPLPRRATIRVHGLHLGADLLFIGVEAELVGELAELITEAAGERVVFAMGYTDGVRLNLPSDRQLPQGGYGVDTAWEFHWPASLAPGIDDTVREAVRELLRNLPAGANPSNRL